jgi:hypothetical protein
MECTKCHRILDIKNFSYKNAKQKIFYLHCDKCREKISNQPNKKIAEKEQYETLKKTNLIICPICSREYVSFRTYHTIRHNNSKIHLKSIAKTN